MLFRGKNTTVPKNPDDFLFGSLATTVIIVPFDRVNVRCIESSDFDVYCILSHWNKIITHFFIYVNSFLQYPLTASIYEKNSFIINVTALLQ